MTNPTTNKPDAIEQILDLLTNQVTGLYTKYETGKRVSQELSDCISDYHSEALAAIYKEIERVGLHSIGENEVAAWDEDYNMCNNCEFERIDDSKDCLCRIRNKLRNRQRQRLTKALEDMKGENQ